MDIPRQPLPAPLPIIVPPPPAPTADSEPPLARALQSARQGQLNEARHVLGITPEEVPDEELVNGLMGLEEGLQLAAQNRQHEAVEPFRRAAAVISHSSDEQSRFFVSLMASQSEGYSKLLSGDALGAYQLLNVGADALKRLSFFNPAMENAALSAKAESHIALARFHTNVGDMQQVQLWLGKADAIYQQQLAKLDLKTDEGAKAALAIYVNRVEQAVLFARLDMEALDLEAMRDRLAHHRPAYDFVRQHAHLWPAGTLTDVLGLITGLYSVLEHTETVIASSLMARRPLRPEDIRALQRMGGELRRLHDLAAAAGQRGAGFLYTINELRRVHQNLLRAGKVSRGDFGRLGGLISLGALVVLLFTIHLTVRPQGGEALVFFFGATVVALIAGFGYGALRFRALLKQWAALVRPDSSPDEAAPKTGSE